MGYGKYLMGKTGLFEKFRPQASDVLVAAFNIYKIERVTTRGRRYFYIIPSSRRYVDINRLLHVFRNNGIFLRPHSSRHYDVLFFRVPDRGQEFLCDVLAVAQNASTFRDINAKYINKRYAVSDFLKIFAKTK